ncbi:MAG: hypothetical protein ACKVP0_24305 [Pirellulaceae bacterium]
MTEISFCPNCRVKVVLRPDGSCPGCQATREEAPKLRQQALAKNRREAYGRLKSVNVAIGVFLLLWILFLIPLGLGIRVVVNDVLHVPESDLVYQGKRLLAHVLSATFAFLIIRRLWPVSGETDRS